MALSSKDRAIMHEDRFVTIEIKLAQQEDLVESLNQMVYQQSRRIDHLETLLGQLAEHIRNNAQSGSNPINDRPPHY
jgi:SlyX protein